MVFAPNRSLQVLSNIKVLFIGISNIILHAAAVRLKILILSFLFHATIIWFNRNVQMRHMFCFFKDLLKILR